MIICLICLTSVSAEEINNESDDISLSDIAIPIEDNSLNEGNIVANSTIVSRDLIKYYKNDSRFCVNVFDENGTSLVNSQVQFTINGVTYTRISDVNGTAMININLSPEHTQ